MRLGGIMKCVLSVLGPDRTGIVADVTGALAGFGANIDDITQTVLDGVFSMTLITTLDLEKAGFDEVQEEMIKISKKLGIQIFMQREDVFRAMYEL